MGDMVIKEMDGGISTAVPMPRLTVPCRAYPDRTLPNRALPDLTAFHKDIVSQPQDRDKFSSGSRVD